MYKIRQTIIVFNLRWSLALCPCICLSTQSLTIYDCSIFLPTVPNLNIRVLFSYFKGLSFSLGSRSRANIKAETDGVAVKNLRDAGGIPLAVTNIPEFCSSYETNNFITGYTRNPYNLRRTAGGSSGGEVRIDANKFSFFHGTHSA